MAVGNVWEGFSSCFFNYRGREAEGISSYGEAATQGLPPHLPPNCLLPWEKGMSLQPTAQVGRALLQQSVTMMKEVEVRWGLFDGVVIWRKEG